MRKWILINLFPSSTYLHPLWETDEVSGENVGTTICDEGDGLILCKWDSHGKVVSCDYCPFVFSLVCLEPTQWLCSKCFCVVFSVIERIFFQ